MLPSRQTILTLVLMAVFGLSNSALVKTCPTDLKRGHHGYWYSDMKPGWKAHKTTPDGVMLSANNFASAVYSPKRQRMACVYKASNNKWVALVSNTHYRIIIDKSAMDDSGDRPAWQFNKKHQDYACGQPTVAHIKDCPFQLAD